MNAPTISMVTYGELMQQPHARLMVVYTITIEVTQIFNIIVNQYHKVKENHHRSEKGGALLYLATHIT